MLEPLVEDPEARAIPREDLETVAAPIPDASVESVLEEYLYTGKLAGEKALRDIETSLARESADQGEPTLW